jgi:hypothetical protein
MLLNSFKFFAKEFIFFFIYLSFIKWMQLGKLRREFISKYLFKAFSNKKEDNIEFVKEYYELYGRQCPVCGQMTSNYYICLYCGHKVPENHYSSASLNNDKYYIENDENIYLG